MPEVKGFDTYWEDLGGKTTYLTVNYHSTEEGIEILNIRTTAGQDPMMVVKDWDRKAVVRILKKQIKLKEKEDAQV